VCPSVEASTKKNDSHKRPYETLDRHEANVANGSKLRTRQCLDERLALLGASKTVI
jgi:hypothetical protein